MQISVYVCLFMHTARCIFLQHPAALPSCPARCGGRLFAWHSQGGLDSPSTLVHVLQTTSSAAFVLLHLLLCSWSRICKNLL